MSKVSPEKPTSDAQGTSVPQTAWEFGDIGFDTEKRLWFVQLYNEANQNVGTYMGKQIVLRRGRAVQYQWKDAQGRAFWHVRERFFADEIESVGIDPSGALLTVVYKEGKDRAGTTALPDDYSYILYAFHLLNKEAAGNNKAPLGFLEFYNSEDKMVGRLNNRWIMIEDVDRKSVGDYPKIRLRIERKDVQKIITTRTSVAIQGRAPKNQQNSP
jgi:hypothetical protein